MKSPGITLSSKGGDPGRNEPHPEQGEAVTIFHLLRFTAVNGRQLYPANKVTVNYAKHGDQKKREEKTEEQGRSLQLEAEITSLCEGKRTLVFVCLRWIKETRG
ncbi:hypothetical protein K0M31_007429 [Melipona bicolor]|uniref:Uncharacterized protein n=1 Tax=Melipona bicolor TaxID=60889 RepID=A0AA40GBE5_9HYME|nr:hypothetical protein K0M31_007429 [Melipona bicolor]